MSRLFATPFVHCVDDMICIERLSTIHSGFHSWRLFADLCGWNIPDSKSPLPAQVFMALGAELRLAPLPLSDASVRITAERAKALRNELMSILKASRLMPGHAARIGGKLGFAVTQLFGRIGKAKLRPFLRRQYERSRSNLNAQLIAAIEWWLYELKFCRPRLIPRALNTRKTIVSYSDGEGADAFIGIAAWSSASTRPVAGRIAVPDAVRRRWESRRHTASTADLRHSSREYTDIYEIEALGPLLVLHNFEDLLQGAFWMHYIDNAAALAGMIRGSSSVSSGDEIIGETWSRIHKLDVLAWFDRVESKSNPVDGLSRGDLRGMWELVDISVPASILTG